MASDFAIFKMMSGQVYDSDGPDGRTWPGQTVRTDDLDRLLGHPTRTANPDRWLGQTRTADVIQMARTADSDRRLGQWTRTADSDSRLEQETRTADPHRRLGSRTAEIADSDGQFGRMSGWCRVDREAGLVLPETSRTPACIVNHWTLSCETD